ncbi:hypothetical protein CBA19C6_20265 [Cupriavidus pauculus]|nr:hypothetical protein CBA19C6_20265 [Cupriavidus pauculus]
MKLGLFLLAAGHHAAGWRYPDAESGTENIDLVVRMTQAAERAKFDMVFFGDRLLTSADAHPSMITRPDPLAILAALSMVTTHVGLAATASTTYSEPFNLARTLATVDKLSHGRAAWNRDHLCRWLGELQPQPPPRARRALRHRGGIRYGGEGTLALLGPGPVCSGQGARHLY